MPIPPHVATRLQRLLNDRAFGDRMGTRRSAAVAESISWEFIRCDDTVPAQPSTLRPSRRSSGSVPPPRIDLWHRSAAPLWTERIYNLYGIYFPNMKTTIVSFGDGEPIHSRLVQPLPGCAKLLGGENRETRKRLKHANYAYDGTPNH